MSVGIATFNHFDVFSTKETLFPPSGGLHSIKAAQSVKISTLLGVGFFLLCPPWRNYCSKGMPARGELCCRLPNICFVPFALSAKCLHLKINGISCCLERVPVLASHCRSPALCSGSWRADCTAAAAVTLGLLSSACWGWGAAWMPDWVRAIFTPSHLRSWQQFCLGDLREKPSGSPGSWVHWALSCDHDQGGRSIFFLVGLLLRRPACQMRLRIFCDTCIPLQTRAGWSSSAKCKDFQLLSSLSACLAGDLADFLICSVH